MKIEFVPYEKEFLERLFKWRSQPASVRHNPFMVSSIEEYAKRCESDAFDIAQYKSVPRFRWYIEADGELCGFVSLKEINLMMMTAEIGYAVNEGMHSRGIATAAIRKALDLIFEKTELRKIIAIVHDENLASIRVLEKLGFLKEGLLREHFIINGKPVNEIAFGLLRREWR
jgi:ribosomal-protein-alanine N-acetyltransferase